MKISKLAEVTKYSYSENQMNWMLVLIIESIIVAFLLGYLSGSVAYKMKSETINKISESNH
jgi:hypothetical protein